MEINVDKDLELVAQLGARYRPTNWIGIINSILLIIIIIWVHSIEKIQVERATVFKKVEAQIIRK